MLCIVVGLVAGVALTSSTLAAAASGALGAAVVVGVAISDSKGRYALGLSDCIERHNLRQQSATKAFNDSMRTAVDGYRAGVVENAPSENESDLERTLYDTLASLEDSASISTAGGQDDSHVQAIRLHESLEQFCREHGDRGAELTAQFDECRERLDDSQRAAISDVCVELDRLHPPPSLQPEHSRLVAAFRALGEEMPSMRRRATDESALGDDGTNARLNREVQESVASLNAAISKSP